MKSLYLFSFLCAFSVAAASTAYPSTPGLDSDDCSFAGTDRILIPPRREVYDDGRIYDISHKYIPETPVYDSNEGLGHFRWLEKSMKNGSRANNSAFKLGAHTGTHVDSPGHFYDNYYDAGFDVDTLDLRVLNDSMMSDEEEWDYLLNHAAGAPPPRAQNEPPSTEIPIPVQEPLITNANPLRTVPDVDLTVEDEDEGLDTRGRQKRKAAEVAEGEGRQVTKKKKSKGKGKKHHHSLALDQGFIKRSSEEYQADPVSATVNVILHMADVARSKYEVAEKNLAAETQKREEAEKNLTLVEAGLKIVRADLEILRKARESLAKEKESWINQKKELDARIAELEDQEKKDQDENVSLKAQIADLQKSLEDAQAAPVTDSTDRVAELEQLLANEKAHAARAVQAAINQRKAGFNLALKQAKVYHPGFEFPEAIFSSDYKVEGDSIVQVDRQSKSKTVIYSSKDQ